MIDTIKNSLENIRAFLKIFSDYRDVIDGMLGIGLIVILILLFVFYIYADYKTFTDEL